MLNITILPYLVFILMAVPPFILGYFKGWRSGFFTLILIMCMGGILVGIFFAIYDNSLWPLFKNSFIRSHNPAGLDVETLKEISKHSVISISVGIMIVPTILIVWALYMAFKKLLNKYMLPKLKKISPNEVKISRKNLKRARIGGVVINGATGLIVASAAASAVATLSTPSSNSNFFHRMINDVSYGMTFGQAQYDVNYQKTFEFLNNGGEHIDEIKMFRKLFGLPQDSKGNFKINPTDLSNFKTSTKYAEFLESTNKIARNSKEVSKALFLMFMNASTNKQPFNLVGFDSKLGAIEHADKTKVANSESDIATSISVLENFVKNNKTNIKWNSDGVREAATQFLKSRFIDFEKSQYYYDWKKKDDENNRENKLLVDMKNEYSELIKSIPEDRNKQSGFVSAIKEGINPIKDDWAKIKILISAVGKGGINVVTSSPKIMNTLQTQNWVYTNNDGTQTPQKIFNSNILLNDIPSPVNLGSFDKKEIARKLADTNERKAEADKKVTDNDQNTLNSFRTLLNQLNTETSNKQLFTNEKNNEEKKKIGLDSDLKTLNNDWQVIKNKESNAMTKMNQQKIISDASDSKYSSELARLKTAQAIFNSAAAAVQTAKNNNIPDLTAVNADLAKAQDALNINKENIKNFKITRDYDLAEWNKLKSIYDGISNDATRKRNEITNKQASINISNGKINDFEQKINGCDSSLRTINSQLTTLKNNVGTLINAQNKYNSSRTKSDASRALATKTKINFDALNNIFQNQLQQIQNLKQQMSISETKINNNLSSEKSISNKLLKNIKRRILLENKNTVKGSIESQKLIISKLKIELDILANTKNTEHVNYNDRSSRLINSIVIALS